MADYYPLIARAVGTLNPNTPEQRRALYDRARRTLVDQLRIKDPTLPRSSASNEILPGPPRHRRLARGRDPVRRRPMRSPMNLPGMATCRRLRIPESVGGFSSARALPRF
jgi:hypothetical protein